MENFLLHIHPITVHFPLAFITFAFFAETINRFIKQNYFLKKCSYNFQIIGTVTFLVAIFTGLVFTKEPTGQAQEIEELHELFGFITLGILLTGALLKYYIVQNQIDNNKYLNLSYILSLLGFISIVLSGFFGGTLVYNYLLKIT